MGEISIIHGRVLINDISSTKKFLDNYKFNSNFPLVTREMFSIGSEIYYDNPILNFGATYKNVGEEPNLASFLIKFEDILKNISFNNAKLEFETEFSGEYHFFWGTKYNSENQFYKGYGLIEYENWFFGSGYRHMFGMLLNNIEEKKPFDISFPIEFNQKRRKSFNNIVDELNKIELNAKRYFPYPHPLLSAISDDLILTYLSLKNQLEYGYDPDKGKYVKRLKIIEKIKTVYNKI